MHPTSRNLLAPSLTLVAVLVLRCGGSTTNPVDPNRVPKVHRASAMTCDMSRPSGITDAGADDAGDSGLPPIPDACTTDADCTKGKNGRCGFVRIGKQCSYDTCFSDTDCASGEVCHCRAGAQDANFCVGMGGRGACRVDSDCGAKGFCSPSYGPCGDFSPYIGYFCHTKDDACLDDSDCNDGGAGAGAGGYCAFDTAAAKWKCSYSHCAG